MGVSLQINVAPPDAPHAVYILPHQLRVWAAQVDEIVFTLDTVRPTAGRFTASWDERLPAMNRLLEDLVSQYPHARVAPVDPSPEAVADVARAFFGRGRIPMKDSRGGPLYSYLYGLHDAGNDLVLHCDSDIVFGGGSETWTAEATNLMRDEDDVLFTCPLPGPPRSDGRLLGQPGAVPVAGLQHAHRFTSMSTRVFLLDRARLRARVGAMSLPPPLLLRSRVKALVKGNPQVAMPEQIVTLAMRQHGLSRVDLLGSPPGTWSLHPAFRSSSFYAALPEMIGRVESGDIPEQQRGRYDIVDELFDFSEVRRKYRRSPLSR